METVSNLLLIGIDNERIYIGLTEGPFKERLSDHRTFLSMNNTKINQNYLLLSGKQKIRNGISKLSGR